MIKIINILCIKILPKYSYRVVKKQADSLTPIPHMDQYYLCDDHDKIISFWNDVKINIDADTTSIGIQIPKEQSKKFQVVKTIPHHPLMQDTRKNKFTKQFELRHYAKFPLFNYGFIPQTWEQNITKNSDGLFGDDDPIDVCDLSQQTKSIGDIFKAKILGSFCLIDEGEIDWKILTMSDQEAKNKNVNNLGDIDPRRIESILKWFKYIKTFDNKPPNTIAHQQKLFSKNETMEIIKQTHQEWVKLKTLESQSYAQKRKQFLF